MIKEGLSVGSIETLGPSWSCGRDQKPRTAGALSKPRASVDALGRIEPLFGQTVVIKYGGAAMEKPGLRDLFSRDIALARTLGVKPVVVHGGGPQIDRLMKRLGKRPHFVGGLRITDDETMDIVEMVLAGSININADLVAADVAATLGAVKVIFLSDVPGIRGRDGRFLQRVTLSELDALIREGVIDAGMLPKVEACARALKGGVGAVYIVDGRLPNALLLKLFTHTGLGTEIVL